MVDWPSPQTISLLQSSIILSLINQLHSSSLFNKRNKGEVDAAEINGVDWSGIPPLQEERQLITHNKREERQPFIYSIPSTHQLIFSFFIEFKEKMNWSWVAFSFWKKKRKAGCPLLKKREEERRQLLQQFHEMKGSTLIPSFHWSCWGAYRAAGLLGEPFNQT